MSIEDVKKTRKKKLQEHCSKRFSSNYDAGGIGCFNEYNWFLCILTPTLVEYLSVEGLEYLKAQLDEIYENMPEYDKPTNAYMKG